jgi:cell fate regulator YaaT (PSP1 superfamily)
MLAVHFVRVGVLGHVGRFASADQAIYARGRRVVCRTRRGVEIGEVLGSASDDAADFEMDGRLLRAVTVEDQLLLARLERNRDEAYLECERLLRERELDVALIDVEHLFDGQSLYFYFLGDVSPEIEALTRELAEAYETKVQFRQFADAVERGCGPTCGTAEATGCGTGCTSCAVASACQKH